MAVAAIQRSPTCSFGIADVLLWYSAAVAEPAREQQLPDALNRRRRSPTPSVKSLFADFLRTNCGLSYSLSRHSEHEPELYKGILCGRYWDRTSDPCRVKAVLSR
jgi:hypothetical protein